MNNSIKKFYEIFNVAKLLFNNKLISISKENSSVVLEHLSFDFETVINSSFDNYSASKVSLADAYRINFQNQLLFNYTRERVVDQNITYESGALVVDSIVPITDNNNRLYYIYINNATFDIELVEGDTVCFQLLEDSGNIYLNAKVVNNSNDIFNLKYSNETLYNFNNDIFQNNFEFIHYDNTIEGDKILFNSELLDTTSEDLIFSKIANTSPELYNQVVDFLNTSYVYLVDLIKVYENENIVFENYEVNFDILSQPLVLLDVDIEYASGDTFILNYHLLDEKVDITNDLFAVIDVDLYWNWDNINALELEANVSIYKLLGNIKPFQVQDNLEIINDNNLEVVTTDNFDSDLDIMQNTKINISGEFVEMYKNMNKNRLNDNLNCDFEAISYGFYFNGATRISAYTNETLNMNDTIITFDVIKGLDDDVTDFLYRGSTFTGNSFSIYFTGDKLKITINKAIGAEGKTITNTSFYAGVKRSVKIVVKANGTNKNVSIWLDDGVDTEGNIRYLYDSGSTYTSNYETFNITTSDDYGFGAYYNDDDYTLMSNSVISNFIIETDGVEVFNEPFNGTTKGTITGTEQYMLLDPNSNPLNKTEFEEFDFVLKFSDNNSIFSEVISIKDIANNAISVEFKVEDLYVDMIGDHKSFYNSLLIENELFESESVNINTKTIIFNMKEDSKDDITNINAYDNILITNTSHINESNDFSFYDSVFYNADTTDWNELLGKNYDYDNKKELKLMNRSLEILNDGTNNTDVAILSQIRDLINYYTQKNNSCKFAIINCDSVNRLNMGGRSVVSFNYTSSTTSHGFSVNDISNKNLEYIRCNLTSTNYNFYTENSNIYVTTSDEHDIEFKNISNYNFNIKSYKSELNDEEDEIVTIPYSRVEYNESEAMYNLINLNTTYRSHLDMMLYPIESFDGLKPQSADVDVLQIADSVPSEDVIGFDFNGSTYIKSNEVNIEFQTHNMALYFEFKKQQETKNAGYLYVMATVSAPLAYIEDNTNLYIKNIYRVEDLSDYMDDLENDKLYRVMLNTYKNTEGFIINEYYVNGELITTAIVSGSEYTEQYPSNFNTAHFGSNSSANSSFNTNSILANFTMYGEALTEQECIDITSGEFDNTDSRIDYYRSFNNTVGDSIVTGTEQYATISSTPIGEDDDYCVVQDKSEDKYGFDFDGATQILLYTNPTINGLNSNYKFTIIKQDTDKQSVVFQGGFFVNDWISFYFNDNNKFEVQMLRTDSGSPVFSYLYSTLQYNIDDKLEVELDCYTDNNDDTFWELIIDGVSNQIHDFGNNITSFDYPLSQDDSVYGFSYPWISGTKYTSSVLSNFVVYSDDIKVFEETFNNTTLGTITGTEQYSLISEEAYHSNAVLYQYYNEMWNAESISLGYVAYNLDDNLYYTYGNDSDSGYDVFINTSRGIDDSTPIIISIDNDNINLFNEDSEYRLLLNKMVYYNKDNLNIDADLNLVENIDYGHKAGIREYYNSIILEPNSVLETVEVIDNKVKLTFESDIDNTNFIGFLLLYNDLRNDEYFGFNLEKQTLLNAIENTIEFDDDNLDEFRIVYNLSDNKIINKDDIYNINSDSVNIINNSNLIRFYRLENEFSGFRQFEANANSIEGNIISFIDDESRTSVLYKTKYSTDGVVNEDVYYESDKYDSYLYFKNFKEIHDNKFNITNSYILTENVVNIDNINEITDHYTLSTNLNNNLNIDYRTNSSSNNPYLNLSHYSNLNLNHTKNNSEFYLFNIKSEGRTKYDSDSISDDMYDSLALFKNDNIDVESFNYFEAIVNDYDTDYDVDGGAYWDLISFENSKSFELTNEIHTANDFNYMIKRRYKDMMKKSNYIGFVSSFINEKGYSEFLGTDRSYISYEYGLNKIEMSDYNNNIILFENIVDKNPDRIRRLVGDFNSYLDNSEYGNNKLFDSSLLNSDVYNNISSVAFKLNSGTYYREAVIPCYFKNKASDVVTYIIDISDDLTSGDDKNDLIGDGDNIIVDSLIINDTVIIKSDGISVSNNLISVNTSLLNPDDLIKLSFVKGIKVLIKHTSNIANNSNNIIETPVKNINIIDNSIEVEVLYKVYNSDFELVETEIQEVFIPILKHHNNIGEFYGNSDGKFGVSDERLILKSVGSASRKNIPIVLFNPIEIYHPTGFKKFIENDDIRIKTNDVMNIEIKEEDYDNMMLLDSDEFSNILIKMNNVLYKYIGTNDNIISSSLNNISDIDTNTNDLTRSDYLKTLHISDILYKEEHYSKPNRYYMCFPNFYNYKLLEDLEIAGKLYDVFEIAFYKYDENYNISTILNNYTLSDDKLIKNLQDSTFNLEDDDLLVITNKKDIDDTFSNSIETTNRLNMYGFYNNILNFDVDNYDNFQKNYDMISGDMYANDSYAYGTYFNIINNIAYGFSADKNYKYINNFGLYKNKFSHYEMIKLANSEIEIETDTSLPNDINNYRYIKQIGNKI